MGCVVSTIAAIVLFLVVLGASWGMGLLGLSLMLIGAYRLVLALRSGQARRVSDCALLIASSASIVALHGLLLPTLVIFAAWFFVTIPDLYKVVEGADSLLTLAITLLVWVPTLRWALREIDGRASRRASPAAVSWFQRARASVYRLPLVPAPQTAGNSPRFVVSEARHASALLALHGIFVAAPFVASRLCSLIVGTAPRAMFITDPAVVAGGAVLVGSVGLLPLCAATEDGNAGRSTRLGGALLSLLSTLVSGGVVAGLVPITWDLVHRSPSPDPTTLPDFFAQRLFGGSEPLHGPFGGAVPSWSSALTWLLVSHAALVLAATVLLLRPGARTREPARPG